MDFLQFFIRSGGGSGRQNRAGAALAALGLLLFASVGHAAPATAPTFLHGRRGAVASDSELASRAGIALLRAGGNAVDAACAAALALGVVHPFASGLGGGGFAMVHLAAGGRTVALDFRETAPAAFAPPRGIIPPQSGHSVGVPGEVAGLAELVRRHGALPFARCVAPALRLAGGFPASPWLVRQLGDEIDRHPDSAPALLARVFELGGREVRAIKPGDILARPRLARTLRRLRNGGARAFYGGPVAAAIAAAVVQAGGAMTVRDLAAYRPVVRAPIEVGFLGRRVMMMPPPSAGGIIIAQALGMLGQTPVTGPPPVEPMSADHLHLVAEALKHGFADRARFLGDPGFTKVPLERLLDPAYHRELARRTRGDAVLAHESYGWHAPIVTTPARDAGTAHISVVDGAGNAVALTTTINLEFGARIVAGGTGILLNDELDDFTTAPGRPDVFSLSGGIANQPAPGKRPASAMSPTIVLGPRGVELVTGAAGGPRIVSTTLQLLLDVLRFGRSAEQAMALPRIHHQWEPDELFHEPGVAPEIVRALAAKGHHPQPRGDIAKANLIVRTRAGVDAAADPRSGGAPAVY